MNRAAAILERDREHRAQARYGPWLLMSWLVATMLLGAGCQDLLGLDIPVPVPRCGDRMLDTYTGEQCDHGGVSATCDDDCSLAWCGDGRLNEVAGEQCDDAGESARCNDDCTLARCGDGIINPAAEEACDQAGDSLQCDRDCSPVQCGDGIVNRAAGETCDDAGAIGRGACTPLCQPARCGDGFVYPDAEACDDGNDDHTDFCTTTCQASECDDGLHNGAETDLDCGGSCASGCRSGQFCSADSDCFSGMCRAGSCVSARLVTGEDHTCVMLEGGTVRCWGRNDDGQLGYEHRDWIGDDETPRSAGDVQVIRGRAVQLSAAYDHTCALLEDGTTQCWGSGWSMNAGGRAVPIAAGAEHPWALLEPRAMRWWGSSAEAELGYGHTHHMSAGDVASAGDVMIGGRVVQIVNGDEHTCALRGDGHLRCWGENDSGKLGYGHTEDIEFDELPSSGGYVDVGGRAVQLAAGREHTCALLEDGAIRCWGENDYGKLGYGHTWSIGGNETPGSVDVVDVGGRAVQIATGEEHTCALLENGDIRCWGYNWYGQLGYGNIRRIGDDEMPSSVDPVSYR